jgi:predicted nucleic-acid-binding protein
MFCLAAGDNEDAFWVQLLVVVILVAGVGIYGMVKSRARRVKRESSDETIETLIKQPTPRTKRRDLTSGMEMLASDFLVGIVEQTDTVDQRDIAMQQLCFAELVRRRGLWAVASEALKVYVLDDGKLFSKEICCEAMKELAERTGKVVEQTVDKTEVRAVRELNG